MYSVTNIQRVTVVPVSIHSDDVVLVLFYGSVCV